MVVLQIEHALIVNFDGWKQAFDSDPIGRQRMGVRRYRIMRPVNDPNFAIIELEFDTAPQAEALLAAMREVWGRVRGTLIQSPQARITEIVESIEM
ncbi:MAG TPA: hypothetical protein VFS83_15065 [Ktedonobacterales bacterium]|nr:hypothetical protein [Ktedonobacterales bacterium]